MFDESELPTLRKCVVFYTAISQDEIPEEYGFKRLDTITLRKIKQMSQLYWVKDAAANRLTVDLDWWHITRISGSDGYRFEDRKSPGIMYPQTGTHENLSQFLCFTGIDQYLKIFKDDPRMHVGLFTVNDIVEYINSSENFSGIVINPLTESNCFIKKEAFSYNYN